MSTKTLNTRIQTKIDTLENWKSSTLPLLPGEIAIATGAVEIAEGLSEPVCIIRIGEEGNKTFSQLPDALHAKAIDVLPICKDTEALTEFILNTLEEADISKYVATLTYEDEAQAGYYVSSVSQNAGLISVTREALPNFLSGLKLEIGEYNNVKDNIIIKDEKDNVITAVDASIFVKDGMLESAVYDKTTHQLTLTWNTASGIADETIIELDSLVDVYTSGDGIDVGEDGRISINAEVSNLILENAKAIKTITANGTENNPSGLVATKGENNDYNIAIDDSVTFIFNCGGAGATA